MGGQKHPNNGKWQNPGRLVKKDGRWQWISEGNHQSKDPNVVLGSSSSSPGNNRHLNAGFKNPNRNKSFYYIEKNSISIFVTNLPWKATVKEVWDACMQWGTVVDVFVASKKAKNGARFGFVRYKNVSDIQTLVNNIRETWMGNFHLFADVARYNRYDNRPDDPVSGAPLNGKNNQSMGSKDGHTRFVEVNVSTKNKSYADALSGFNIGSVANNTSHNDGVSETKEDSGANSNGDVVEISEDDGMDYLNVEHSILAKVIDLSVISDISKLAAAEGFSGVALRYLGGRWVWMEFNSMEQIDRFTASSMFKALFSEFSKVSPDFIPDERCVWIDLVGLPLASWAPQAFKKIGGRWGTSVFVDLDEDGPMAHGKVCVLTNRAHRVFESFKVSFRNKEYNIHATEYAYWVPELESSDDDSSCNSGEGSDGNHVNSDGEMVFEDDTLEEGEINEAESSDLSSTERMMNEVDTRGKESVPANCDLVNSGNGESAHDDFGAGFENDSGQKKWQRESDPFFNDGPLRSNSSQSNDAGGEDNNVVGPDQYSMTPNADEAIISSKNYFNSGDQKNDVVTPMSNNDDLVSGDKAEGDMINNSGLDDHDVFLLNRLIHQDKCRVRHTKAAASSDLILAVEASSTWLDYVGPLTDELDPEICWSYNDPSGNVQGPFSLAQLHTWKDYFSSNFEIWRYYGSVKETVFLHSALKRRTNVC